MLEGTIGHDLFSRSLSSAHSVQSLGDADSNSLGNVTTTVFVGDLSIFVGEGDLLLAFEPFGTVLDVKVMRCEETQKNLSYGFVKFADAQSAAAAMAALNGKLLCGRPMRYV